MRLLSSLVLLIISGSVGAADFQKSIAPAPKSELIRESEALTVLSESSVQKTKDNSRRVYALLVSGVQAQKISIFANNNRVDYPAQDRQPAIGAQFAYLPWMYHGYFGVTGSMNYSYMEVDDPSLSGTVRTALHWVMTDLSLIYRYEPNRTAFFKPFVGVGGGSYVFVQRGPTDYNTSEAQGVGIGFLGLSLNLTRLFALNSPLLWELTTQYKRVVGPREQSMDLNGDQLSLGLELAL